MSFSFYSVDPKYGEYLRQFEQKVSFLSGGKEKRPFIGIVFSINKVNYFAPLTSPKPKHMNMKNQIDFLKIDGGKYGAINFNNMIPVPGKCLIKISMIIDEKKDSKTDIEYKYLLRNQLTWCNSNKNTILKYASKLYTQIVQNKARPELSSRCCNFKIMEQKCILYDREKQQEIRIRDESENKLSLMKNLRSYKKEIEKRSFENTDNLKREVER